jgi:hypothetical protein
VNVPDPIQKDDKYTAAVSIYNPINVDYVSAPYEKVLVSGYITQKSNDSDIISRIKQIEMMLPLAIHPNSTLNIPFYIDTPKTPGTYTLVINISDDSNSYAKSLETQFTTLDTINDSIYSTNVNVTYLDYNIPSLVHAGDKFTIKVTAINSGTTLWRASVFESPPTGQVSLGSTWYKDGSVTWNGDRGLLPYDIAPGERVTIEKTLYTPTLPGNYTLKLDFVDEKLTWFSDRGSEMIMKNITVI